MKTIIKVLGIITIVAAIVFSMTACDKLKGLVGGGGGGGGGSGLTIKGLSDANGLYAMAQSTSMLYAAKSYNEDYHDLQQISGGSVTLNVWKITFNGEVTAYSGNDQNVSFGIYIYDSPKIMVQGSSDGKRKGVGSVTVNFSNGKATETVDWLNMK